MRHLKAHRKLGRSSEHRVSMLRNLATSLINSRDERIVTTLPKAKELRPFVERVITLSRRAASLAGNGSDAAIVHLRRQAAAYFHAGNYQRAQDTGRRGTTRPPRTAGVAAVRRLFDELGERFKDRPGGYTRIMKLGQRQGDGTFNEISAARKKLRKVIKSGDTVIVSVESPAASGRVSNQYVFTRP